MKSEAKNQVEEMPEKSVVLMTEARDYVRCIIAELMLIYKEVGKIEKADRLAVIINELDGY